MKKSVPEIAAFQWLESQKAILNGLKALSSDRWMGVDYASFIADPDGAMTDIASFCGLESTAKTVVTTSMPLSSSTVSQPAPEKWRRYEAVMEPLFPALKAMNEDIAAFCSQSD